MTLLNPNKVDLRGWMVGLPRLLGKILSLIRFKFNLTYLLNFLFYCINICQNNNNIEIPK